MNISISSLYLSWNDIHGEGCILIAKSLIENTHIKVLDISFNPLGSLHFQKSSWITAIWSMFKENKSLMHIDFSYVGFSQKDIDNLNFGLQHNHHILGIHMIGNHGGIDSLGFWSSFLDPPSASQLITKLDQNLKAGEVDAKDLDLQRWTNCWIWEGWTPVTFRFIQKFSNIQNVKLKDKWEVFLHLSIDNFEPDIMFSDKSKPGEFYKVRMVPATSISHYFSIENLPRIRTDIETIAPNENDQK